MTGQPLLALTRHSTTPLEPPSETTAKEGMLQLVQLRWIAVAGQLATILVVHFGLGVRLPLAPMLILVGLLGLANLGWFRWPTKRLDGDTQILLALLFDAAALTAQLYLSGGATNPFISLYLLQVVLGAILLKAPSVWILVAATSVCYAALTLFYEPLAFPALLLPQAVDLYKIGAWLSFVLVGVLLTLFILRISQNLRARDARLAELRRHAVEEENIVRMGLFASGAAHELGTPLASLSVILNDWRRMPQLARDPALAEELGEMEAEVQRCKSIVNNILDVAGAPRGEAMTSVGARRFVDEVADAWRRTHPNVDLRTTHEGPPDAATVSSPALRQALWNLLDNAAEASPKAVTLLANAGPEDFVVSVLDQGSGFPAEQLPHIGRPIQSRKGPGHGVGLFLAASTVRKLGGRLEASNRPGGGAEVRLILPLAARSIEAE